MKIESLCVYCGSSPGKQNVYVREAREFGACLAAQGITLVYGGGGVGLMGAVADAVLENGGDVTGVIPAFLEKKELAHHRVSDMHVVGTMHERKIKLMELSDAFVALPGGLGTLEELFEVLAWSQLELHAKPVGILDVAGYYGKLLEFLDYMVGERLLRAEDRARLVSSGNIVRLMEKLVSWQPPAQPKWEDPDWVSS